MGQEKNIECLELKPISNLTVYQNVTEINERLSVQSQMVTLSTGEASEMLESLSSDDDKRLRSLPSSQFQHHHTSKLRNTIRDLLSSTAQEPSTDTSPSSTTTEALRFQNSVMNVACKRRRVGFRLSSTTPLFLGEIYCFVTTYDATQHLQRERDGCSTYSTRQLESSMSFVFVPSKWLVRFGMSQVVRFDWDSSRTRY